MNAISYTAAKDDLASLMTKVCEDCAPVIITRNPAPAVVIMSLADYNALEETARLLRNPKNARRLMSSIAQLDAGRGIKKTLELK